jgi:hypothetical protein
MLATPFLLLGNIRLFGFDGCARAFQNLQASAVATHHGQVRHRHARRRLFALG